MSCKENLFGKFSREDHPPGADALLNYLENKSDFFTAPASARYHLACEGGLCEHSLNVYHCLVDYLQREAGSALHWSGTARACRWPSTTQGGLL